MEQAARRASIQTAVLLGLAVAVAVFRAHWVTAFIAAMISGAAVIDARWVGRRRVPLPAVAYSVVLVVIVALAWFF
jgi:predicted PurR-regulated permease PerM